MAIPGVAGSPEEPQKRRVNIEPQQTNKTSNKSVFDLDGKDGVSDKEKLAAFHDAFTNNEIIKDAITNYGFDENILAGAINKIEYENDNQFTKAIKDFTDKLAKNLAKYTGAKYTERNDFEDGGYSLTTKEKGKNTKYEEFDSNNRQVIDATYGEKENVIREYTYDENNELTETRETIRDHATGQAVTTYTDKNNNVIKTERQENLEDGGSIRTTREKGEITKYEQFDANNNQVIDRTYGEKEDVIREYTYDENNELTETRETVEDHTSGTTVSTYADKNNKVIKTEIQTTEKSNELAPDGNPKEGVITTITKDANGNIISERITTPNYFKLDVPGAGTLDWKAYTEETKEYDKNGKLTKHTIEEPIQEFDENTGTCKTKEIRL